jgi:predicted amidohydrolase
VWGKSLRSLPFTLQEAAENGAKLVAFPELWIPGYPYFLWVKDFGGAMPLTTKYLANALTIDSAEIKQIGQACKELGVWISFGYAERRQSSLYMSNCIINDQVSVISSQSIIQQ